MDFACDLLRQAKVRRIDTSMETCGMVEWESLERSCRYLDSILFDIKSMDGGKHKEFTGVSNDRVLENFVLLCNRFPDLEKHVRTPVIPGFNDSEEEIGGDPGFPGGQTERPVRAAGLSPSRVAEVPLPGPRLSHG